MSAGLEDFSNPLHHPVVPLCIQIIKGGGGWPGFGLQKEGQYMYAFLHINYKGRMKAILKTYCECVVNPNHIWNLIWIWTLHWVSNVIWKY